MAATYAGLEDISDDIGVVSDPGSGDIGDTGAFASERDDRQGEHEEKFVELHDDEVKGSSKGVVEKETRDGRGRKTRRKRDDATHSSILK